MKLDDFWSFALFTFRSFVWLMLVVEEDNVNTNRQKPYGRAPMPMCLKTSNKMIIHSKSYYIYVSLMLPRAPGCLLKASEHWYCDDKYFWKIDFQWPMWSISLLTMPYGSNVLKSNQNTCLIWKKDNCRMMNVFLLLYDAQQMSRCGIVAMVASKQPPEWLLGSINDKLWIINCCQWTKGWCDLLVAQLSYIMITSDLHLIVDELRWLHVLANNWWMDKWKK